MGGAKRIGETANGCGCASGWLRWFRPPYARLFHEDCVAHDELYNDGGTEDNRKAADRKLFRDMVSRGLGCRPGKAVWLAVVALCYYRAVRLLGRRYFDYR